MGRLLVFDFFCKNQLRRGGCPNSVGVGDLPLDAISTALDHARGLRSLGEGRVGRFGEQSAVKTGFRRLRRFFRFSGTREIIGAPRKGT